MVWVYFFCFVGSFYLNKACVGNWKKECEEPSIGGPVLLGTLQHTEKVTACVALPVRKTRVGQCRGGRGGGGGGEMMCVDRNTGKAECVLSFLRRAMEDGPVRTLSIFLG